MKQGKRKLGKLYFMNNVLQFGNHKISSPILFVLFLWIICTLFNINKAVHIDDSFHLEAAQWLAENPLSPLSGKILWGNEAEPMYTFNQPVLYFYILAIVGRIFGWNELNFHLLQSVFTFFCLLYFYKISENINPKKSKLVTLLFCFTPGFISGQNLMVDTSLLMWLLLTFYFLLFHSESKSKNSIWAMIFFTLALMTKYTVIALFPVFIFYFILTQRAKNLYVLFIPILTLLLWSIWNYSEYGGVHLAGRELNPLTFDRVESMFKSMLLTLGGMFVFAWIFIFAIPKLRRRWIFGLISLYLIYLGIDCIRIYFGQINASNLDKNLHVIMMALSGFVLIFSIAAWVNNGNAIKDLIFLNPKPTRIIVDILFLWFSAIGLFILLFAPFMATRHLLLITPPILWLFSEYWNRIPNWVIQVGLYMQIFLGLSTAFADWEYSNFFRESPDWIVKSFPKEKKIWSLGHWGWKWYSEKAGMSILDTKLSDVNPGDILAIPNNYSRQDIPNGVVLSRRFVLKQPARRLNYLFIGHWPRMYASTFPDLPWNFSSDNGEEVHLYYVQGR